MTAPRRARLAALLAAAAVALGGLAATPPAAAAPPDPTIAAPTTPGTAAPGSEPAPVDADAPPQIPVAPPPSGTTPQAEQAIADHPKLDSQLLFAADVPGAAPDTTGDVPRYDNGVNVVVSGPDAAAAVEAAGGEVLAAAGGDVAAYVDPQALVELAQSELVESVRAPSLAVPLGVVTEGVVASGATAWHAAGQTGDGVTVAIIDIGYGGLAQETANGNLPEGLTVRSNQCGSALNSSSHGTAVAEIVHQTAPGAQLALYCIQTSAQFKAAAEDIAAAGITLATSSLGFPGDARGDGVLEDPLSAAAAVRAARQAGVFWIQSAGNSGDSHFRGAFAAAEYQELDRVTAMPFANSVAVEWDQWVGVPSDVRVCRRLESAPPAAEVCSSSNSAPGRAPRAVLSLPAASGGPKYVIRVRLVGAAATELAGVRFDVTYGYGAWNGVASDTIAAHPELTGGSITSPASSPYAFAVGAVDVKTGLREQFSSQGPTIDGRTKPDIAGYDNISSNLYQPTFFGTSAAAPSVAGAAALVRQAHPGWSATQIADYLRASANSGAPAVPPDALTGAGRLTLGAAPPSAAALWVRALYRDVLGRTPGDDEVAFWLGRIAGGQPRPSIVDDFVFSIENRSIVVRQFYVTYLGREADPGGVAYWAEQLRIAPYGAVAALIRSSPEGQLRGSTAQWISAQYVSELGRTAGAIEVNYWAGVRAQAGALSVSSGIIDSGEARTRRATLMYQRFLGRAADAEWVPYWAGEIAARGDLAVWTGFLASPEYYQRATGG